MRGGWEGGRNAAEVPHSYLSYQRCVHRILHTPQNTPRSHITMGRGQSRGIGIDCCSLFVFIFLINCWSVVASGLCCHSCAISTFFFFVSAFLCRPYYKKGHFLLGFDNVKRLWDAMHVCRGVEETIFARQ